VSYYFRLYLCIKLLLSFQIIFIYKMAAMMLNYINLKMAAVIILDYFILYLSVK